MPSTAKPTHGDASRIYFGYTGVPVKCHWFRFEEVPVIDSGAKERTNRHRAIATQIDGRISALNVQKLS